MSNIWTLVKSNTYLKITIINRNMKRRVSSIKAVFEKNDTFYKKCFSDISSVIYTQYELILWHVCGCRKRRQHCSPVILKQQVSAQVVWEMASCVKQLVPNVFLLILNNILDVSVHLFLCIYILLYKYSFLYSILYFIQVCSQQHCNGIFL